MSENRFNIIFGLLVFITVLIIRLAGKINTIISYFDIP